MRHLRHVLASTALLAGTLTTLSATAPASATTEPGQAAAVTTTRYEAETAPAVCTGTLDSDWTGYSGTGFCNGTNATSGAAQFTVNAATAGQATLNVRFANGATAARPASLVVNGTTVQTPSFEATGAWSTWATKTLTVTLNAGSNTVRLNPTTADGLPNVDYVEATTADSTTPPATGALYVSPSGTDGAAGTQSAPTTLTSALSRVAAGGTIYLRGGTYAYASTVTIPATSNGTSAARTTLSAYPGETPVLNFAAQSESSSNRGLQLFGSYWHVYGLVVERAGDNGIYVGGSDNVIERTITRYRGSFAVHRASARW